MKFTIFGLLFSTPKNQKLNLWAKIQNFLRDLVNKSEPLMSF